MTESELQEAIGAIRAGKLQGYRRLIDDAVPLDFITSNAQDIFTWLKRDLKDKKVALNTFLPVFRIVWAKLEVSANSVDCISLLLQRDHSSGASVIQQEVVQLLKTEDCVLFLEVLISAVPPPRNLNDILSLLFDSISQSAKLEVKVAIVSKLNEMSDKIGEIMASKEMRRFLTYLTRDPSNPLELKSKLSILCSQHKNNSSLVDEISDFSTMKPLVAQIAKQLGTSTHELTCQELTELLETTTAFSEVKMKSKRYQLVRNVLVESSEITTSLFDSLKVSVLEKASVNTEGSFENIVANLRNENVYIAVTESLVQFDIGRAAVRTNANNFVSNIPKLDEDHKYAPFKAVGGGRGAFIAAAAAAAAAAGVDKTVVDVDDDDDDDEFPEWNDDEAGL